MHAPVSLTLTGLIKALPLPETDTASTNPQSDLPCLTVFLSEGRGVGGREGPVERGEEAGGRRRTCRPPRSPPPSRLISLPSSWFCSVTSYEGGDSAEACENNRLVLRPTGVLWSVPADGCSPVLHPPRHPRSPSLCCCTVVALARAPTTLSLKKNTHTKKHTLLDIKMDPYD